MKCRTQFVAQRFQNSRRVHFWREKDERETKASEGGNSTFVCLCASEVLNSVVLVLNYCFVFGNRSLEETHSHLRCAVFLVQGGGPPPRGGPARADSIGGGLVWGCVVELVVECV